MAEKKKKKEKKEARSSCDCCEKDLYEGDEYWGNAAIGFYCKECADEEIAFWWGII